MASLIHLILLFSGIDIMSTLPILGKRKSSGLNSKDDEPTKKKVKPNPASDNNGPALVHPSLTLSSPNSVSKKAQLSKVPKPISESTLQGKVKSKDLSSGADKGEHQGAKKKSDKENIQAPQAEPKSMASEQSNTEKKVPGKKSIDDLFSTAKQKAEEGRAKAQAKAHAVKEADIIAKKQQKATPPPDDGMFF